MHPILFKIGPFSIYSYGLMLALGFGLVAYLMHARAHEFGLDKDKMVDMTIFVLIGGLIGGRALYVALHTAYYLARPLEVFDFSKGGLVWYGGFFFALLVFFLFVKFNAMRFWVVADFMAPYVALAQSLGRIGCFLNGCCYGSQTSGSYPLAVVFPDSVVYRYPTQLFSALGLLMIFIVLRLWQDRRHFDGEIFLLYCVLYSSKRFFIEFLRADNPRVIFNLTISQVLSILVMVVSVAILSNKVYKWKRSSSSLR